jgi:hypothetical protein
MHASRIHHRIDKGKVPMVHCLTGALRRILGWCDCPTPRRPNRAARPKELGENKSVAANGLTNTQQKIYYQQQMMIRADILGLTFWRYRRSFGVHLLDVSSA